MHMTLTILEATKLSAFEHFKLVAGHRGLDRVIQKVGILDWEYAKTIEGEPIDSEFVHGEFTLSSLMFAENHPELLIDMVKYLMGNGVSGLAVKDVYFSELPQEVLRFAEEHAFPIFLFSTTYFEDIIMQVNERIKSINDYEAMEAKVDMLIKMHLNKTMAQNVALEINSSFRPCFFAISFKEKRFLSEERVIAAIQDLKNTKIVGLTDAIVKYRQGFLLIQTDDKMDQVAYQKKVKYILEAVDLRLEDYYVGISNLHADTHSNLSDLGYGISESLFAGSTAEVSEKSLCYFKEIGIYRILMPVHQEIWLHNWYNSIITPIIQHDEKYDTELMATAIKYVECDGKVVETAAAMFVHKNTIRYRLNKMKEIMQMEDSNLNFLDQLSVAIKLHKIYHH
jgi:PucR family transcriptional regulator, proline-responsive transcriptional activator